jgi:prohibitin 1
VEPFSDIITQVAQQEAERQTWVVAKSDQERKAAIIRAEGEAEVITLLSILSL